MRPEQAGIANTDGKTGLKRDWPRQGQELQLWATLDASGLTHMTLPIVMDLNLVDHISLL